MENPSWSCCSDRCLDCVLQCYKFILVLNHFERSFVIKKPINEVFYLLSDVDKYQNFIPFCKSSKILELQDDYIIAQLTLDFFGIENSFITKNVIKKNETIIMDLQDGPFKTFHAVWLFKNIANRSTQLDFKMDYELNNPLLEFAFKKNLNSVSDLIVNAFKEKL